MTTEASDPVSSKDVDELRTAVVTLATRVTVLSEALTLVNEVQARQIVNEKKTEEIEKTAHRAKQEASDLAVEVDSAKQQIRDKSAGDEVFRRKALTRIFTTAAALLVLLTLGVGGAVAFTASRSQAARDTCEARNQQNVVIIDILQGSIQDAPDKLAPNVVNVQTGIDKFKALIVDCDKL